MRATSTRANRHASRQHNEPCWLPRKDALAWIASATPDWHFENGTPDIQAIATDLGTSRSSVSRFQTRAVVPSNPVTVAVAEIAAEAHGIPFPVAFARIFCDPSIPDEDDDNWFAGAVTASELVTAYIKHARTYRAKTRPASRIKAVAA
jgi:hypothetical protein